MGVNYWHLVVCCWLNGSDSRTVEVKTVVQNIAAKVPVRPGEALVGRDTQQANHTVVAVGVPIAATRRPCACLVVVAVEYVCTSAQAK